MVLLLDLDGSQDWQLRSWFQARACFLHQGEYDPDKGDNLQLGISSIHFSELSSFFHSGSPATRGTFTGDITVENAKDIIACGFDKSKTFIFSDCEYAPRSAIGLLDLLQLQEGM